MSVVYKPSSLGYFIISVWPDWDTPQIHVEALTPSVTVFGDRAYKEEIKIKWVCSPNPIGPWPPSLHTLRKGQVRTPWEDGPWHSRKRDLVNKLNSAGTLSSDFWPPEFWENKCLLLEFPLWLSELQTQLVSMRMQVWSLALLSGLRIQCCRGCGVAPIRPVAQELPYAAALKNKKQNKTKKPKTQNKTKHLLFKSSSLWHFVIAVRADSYKCGVGLVRSRGSEKVGSHRSVRNDSQGGLCWFLAVHHHCHGLSVDFWKPSQASGPQLPHLIGLDGANVLQLFSPCIRFLEMPQTRWPKTMDNYCLTVLEVKASTRPCCLWDCAFFLALPKI